MATITQKSEHTLVNLANRMNDKKLLDIANHLETEEEVLEDINWQEANGGLIHRESAFTALPQAEWGLLGGFFGAGKAATRQISEQTRSLGLYSKVPVDIAKESGNPAKYRRTEDLAISAGLATQFADALFYGNSLADPNQPTGLKNRYNSLSLSNVHDAGGSVGGDVTGLTSLWIVKNDPSTFFGIYSQGSKAGLDVRDLGEATETASNGKERQVYRTQFRWNAGIMVRDDRYVQRIANVPITTDLSVDISTVWAKFERILVHVINHLPGRNPNGVRIYCNADLMTQFEIKAMEKSNVLYTSGEVYGKPMTMFRGVIPIRRVDAILSTETVVS